MLISPPFLVKRPLNQSEEDWISACMLSAPDGSGKFPVSEGFAWHGGVHLQAPSSSAASGIRLPVCAIADGVIIYVGPVATPNDDVNDPLNYGDTSGYPVWTAKGCVVVEHNPQLGASAAGVPIKVTFYSVYMHLHSIGPEIKKGKRVARMAEIGRAGHIYGEPNLLHFEICCDDENLEKLVGRRTGDLDLSKDGRLDILIGDIYFKLPAGTPVYSSKPLLNYPQAMSRANAESGLAQTTLSTAEAMSPIHETAADLIVGLRYSGGGEQLGGHGDATVTTYSSDGVVLGEPLMEPQATYKLYSTAAAIRDSYPEKERPAVSAVFELLRFGRVISGEALVPIDVPHWREIRYSGGRGWVNLNATGVRKYSDADFPPWQAWKLVDDDAKGDSRCDSEVIRQAVYNSGQEVLKPSLQQAKVQLRSQRVLQALSRTICKFPSEWDAATIDARWSWLQKATDENPESLSASDYENFKAHARALSVDCAGLFSAVWSFEPSQFIRQFRKFCIWPDLISRWGTARSNRVLPRDEDLDDFARTALYEYAMRSSIASITNHADALDFSSFAALDRRDSLIFGMRVGTDINANGGRGLWDDRVIILRRDSTHLLNIYFRGPYTTEPSGRYLDGGQFLSQGNSTTTGLPNAGGDAHKDIGRLISGRTYEYAPWHSSDASKGPNILGTSFNVLRKTSASLIERLVTTSSTLAPGVHVSGNNTAWIRGSDVAKFSEGQTMHFHRGYNGLTGSAGCQTFPVAENQRFVDFVEKLGRFESDSRFQYVLHGL